MTMIHCICSVFSVLDLTRNLEGLLQKALEFMIASMIVSNFVIERRTAWTFDL